MTAGYSAGKMRDGEAGRYWCAGCKGMPVTPTKARTHTHTHALVKPDLPPLPSSVQTSKSTHSCITNLCVVCVCVGASLVRCCKCAKVCIAMQKLCVCVCNDHLVVYWGKRSARTNLDVLEFYVCARTVQPFIKKEGKASHPWQDAPRLCQIWVIYSSPFCKDEGAGDTN